MELAKQEQYGPRIYSDFFYMSEEGVSTPMLALKFSRSGRMAATALEQKGLTQYGVKFFAGFIQQTDEIPPLFCVLQQYSRSFVFRADTLCSWNDASVLSRFFLRKHCRVGTFIRIDFLFPCCCAANSSCPIQTRLVLMRPCTFVAWLKPLDPSHSEVWFFHPCHHMHI